jgi:hypothetical protein
MRVLRSCGGVLPALSHSPPSRSNTRSCNLPSSLAAAQSVSARMAASAHVEADTPVLAGRQTDMRKPWRRYSSMLLLCRQAGTHVSRETGRQADRQIDRQHGESTVTHLRVTIHPSYFAELFGNGAQLAVQSLRHRLIQGRVLEATPGSAMSHGHGALLLRLCVIALPRN